VRSRPGRRWLTRTPNGSSATTGRSVEEWVEAARGAGVDSRAALAAWLKPQGVSGYSLMSVDWAMFGYPDFILRSVDELYEGQYADRQSLRPHR
jgi:hypothetical protein